MEGEKNEYEVNLTKVLSLIIALFAIVGILALIWAKWRVLQICATVDFLAALAIILIPDDWN